ncbi:MAG: nucleoside deaminase [Eggerthellaceae bacterium]
MRESDYEYMRLAMEQARIAASMGEVPIGAVVVYEPIDPATRRPLAQPCVIASACNRREIDNDPAGHAEFLALKAASERLGVWRLTGCTVYVTLEPCIMCAGLMHQARIDRCVFAAPDPKAGALGSLYSVHADERLNHRFEVTPGILEDECAAMLRGFFSARRAAAKAAKAARRAEADQGGAQDLLPSEREG